MRSVSSTNSATRVGGGLMWTTCPPSTSTGTILLICVSHLSSFLHQMTSVPDMPFNDQVVGMYYMCRNLWALINYIENGNHYRRVICMAKANA